MLFLDTETVGLVGPPVLIQTAVGNEVTHLHHVWSEPIDKTLNLLHRICTADICAFNLSFDWFHLVQLYNILIEHPNKDKPPNIYTAAHISEQKPITYCLKPRSALDLFLYLRKTKWQSLMNRRPIRIKKLPWTVGETLAKILKDTIHFDEIYFIKSIKGYEWKVEPNKDDAAFCDIVLNFRASSGLKPICAEIFKVHTDEIPNILTEKGSEFVPVEHSYNPYYSKGWVKVIAYHISYWKDSKHGQEYARRDIEFLQKLYDHFNQPASGDVDSELAICVGACRWRGYSIDNEYISQRIKDIKSEREEGYLKGVPIAPISTRAWLLQGATVKQKLLIPNTSKETLDYLKEYTDELGRRCKLVIESRKRAKELKVLEQLQATGRFCPEFKVIGAKSGRMSGGGELGSSGGSINPQGIKRDKEFRRLFTLSDDIQSTTLHYNGRSCKQLDCLSGGDFESFEVTIVDAAYSDTTLRSDLQSGKSLHGLFGAMLHDMAYEDVLASKNTDHNVYNPSKNSVFALIYGAQPPRIAKTAEVSEDAAESAYMEYSERYPAIRRSREIVFNAFCSLQQPLGIGTVINYTQPSDYIETLLGYRRYFTLENRIIRNIYELAQDLPKQLHIYAKCFRTNREQTVKGAIQSALFATAFMIQSQCQRAAANHVIQGTGAYINKHVQNSVWQLQPSGITDWHVAPFNIHDEIMVTHTKELTKTITKTVHSTVESFREIVPLIDIEWKENLNDWSDKD